MMNKLTSLCLAIVIALTSCKKEDVSPVVTPTPETDPVYLSAYCVDYAEVVILVDGQETERTWIQRNYAATVHPNDSVTISVRSADKYVQLGADHFQVTLLTSQGGNSEFAAYTWTDGQNITHQDTVYGAPMITEFPTWYSYDGNTVTIQAMNSSDITQISGEGTASVTVLP